MVPKGVGEGVGGANEVRFEAVGKWPTETIVQGRSQVQTKAASPCSEAFHGFCRWTCLDLPLRMLHLLLPHAHTNTCGVPRTHLRHPRLPLPLQITLVSSDLSPLSPPATRFPCSSHPVSSFLLFFNQ